MRKTFPMLSLLVILLLAVSAGSQSKAAPPAAVPLPAGPAEASPDPEPQRRQLPELPPPPSEDRFKIAQERAMARERNKQRQAALKKDTDKLLKLASELKEYVDKTNENMLSLDVIKKAEEIEKLSKSVKERMKADEYYPPIGSNLNDSR